LTLDPSTDDLPRPWLQHYPAGVAAQIDTHSRQSLVDVLEDAYAKYAARDAACCMGKRLTYAEVDEMSQALAGWLQSTGLGRGARVAIMMPNVLQYMVAIAAVLRAGYVVVNVNPLYTPRELQHQLKDSGAEAIIVLENFAHTLAQVVAATRVRHVVVAAMGDLLGGAKGAFVNLAVRRLKKMVPAWTLPATLDSVGFKAAVAAGRRAGFKRVAVGADDIAFLQYTGGTTGVSKGATLLHRNVVANLLQADAWYEPVMGAYRDKALLNVCALPLYHIYALTACYLLGARQGMCNLLIPNPRDIPGFIKTLARHKVHIFPAVNTLFNVLANHPDFAKLDFSELLLSAGGGMAVQQATAERWRELTGSPIIEGYGLSETSPIATVNRLDLERFAGSIGMPVPSTDIAIRDDAGRNLPVGERGEICIRGPQVMAGYWNQPEETAKVMTADGFFRSGDIGVLDELGQCYIVDRKKDMILVSGFNVYPTEIEQVVNLHPGVLECAAVGLADERTGEAVKLFVARRDPALTEEQLLGYCREQLTAYKCPKVIEFRSELPKSNVGKILRRELRS